MGNVVTCTLASMDSGAPAWVITVNVTVKLTTPGGTYVNTATVTASSPNDPTPANNTVNNNNTVRATADLSLTKTDGVASVSVGHVHDVHDHRDEQRSGHRAGRHRDLRHDPRGDDRIGDRSPTAPSPPASSDARRRRPLAVGASRSYLLTLSLPGAYAAATVVNTATITTFPIPDIVAANNAATDTDTVPQANLSITKTDSIDPVNPGQSFSYTLTVNNAGPSTATQPRSCRTPCRRSTR